MKFPNYFGILKIVGFMGLALGTVSLVLGVVYSVSTSLWFIALAITGVITLLLSLVCLIEGFVFSSMSKNKTKNDTKEIFIDLNQHDDIKPKEVQEEIATKTKIEEVELPKRHCKHCNAEIDKDSKFCKVCGGKQ